MRPSLQLFLCVVSALLLIHAPTAVRSAACNPATLSSCAGAFTAFMPPSPDCCAKLKQAQPCFCQYLRDPNLRGYISSGNGRRVAATCGVAYPKC